MCGAHVFGNLAAFIENRDGNFTIFFSLFLATMLIVAGAALDFSNSVSTRTQIQEAMDNAVLAAASKGGALDEAYAKSFFLNNIAGNIPGLSDDSDGKTASDSQISVGSISFSTDKDGNVVGSAQAAVKTTLMAVAGISNIDIAVQAKAVGSVQMKIKTATFQITNAQGAYDKDIYFFLRDSDGKITSETLVLQYDYAKSGAKSYKPSKTSSITVNVDDYASYGYKMVVYEDTSYTGKHINPKAYYSDAADASTWTKVKGDCAKGAGSKNNWEDGGDSNYLDFVFTVKCTETASGETTVRLLE